MTSIQPATAGALAPLWDKATIERAVEKPFSLLPPEWRGPAWGFWAKWASLLRSQLDLAASLREWITEEGLTLEEAEQAFRLMCRPECRAAIQFPGQVIGKLAELVSIQVAARRTRERREEAQRREKESRDRADPEGVRKALWERIVSIGCGGQ